MLPDLKFHHSSWIFISIAFAMIFCIAVSLTAEPSLGPNAQSEQNFNLNSYSSRPGYSDGYEILFFYRMPKCTGVCRRQALSFEILLDKFYELGVKIIGVSPGTEADALSFKKTNKLRYDLITDPGSELRNLYDIPVTSGEASFSRQTLIFKNGKLINRIQGIPSSQHGSESYRYIKSKLTES